MDLIKHPEFGEIRTVLRKGEPWFVNQDVCNALGIQRSDRIASGFLDDDEKGLQKMSTPGGMQELAIVNESGLYTLIMRSNKPAAKKFRKWVTGEVLPSIRKNGFYVHPDFANKAELRKLQRQMTKQLGAYLTELDIVKMSKKYGVSRQVVVRVADGTIPNNAIMQECQQRALANKTNEVDAYHPDRIREVLSKLL